MLRSGSVHRIYITQIHCGDDLYRPHIFGMYRYTHNSSMEGAMKLKFAPFCSSWDAFSEKTHFLPKPKFSFSGRKPWTIVHGLNFGSPKNVLRKGYHRKGHLKRSRMVHISASELLPLRSYKHGKGHLKGSMCVEVHTLSPVMIPLGMSGADQVMFSLPLSSSSSSVITTLLGGPGTGGGGGGGTTHYTFTVYSNTRNWL